MSVSGELGEVAARLRDICRSEKKLQLETLELINYLHERDAALELGFASWDSFARYLGLTPNQYWKRLQAARVVRLYPQFKEHLAAARTSLSHLAMAAPKITRDNVAAIERGLCDKKRREVELFLSRIRPDGTLCEENLPTLEVKILLSATEMGLLQRAREVLAAKGKMPTEKDVLLRSLHELLQKRDPERREKPQAPATSKSSSRLADGSRRAHIPASIKYQVFHRDQGRCTFTTPSGERCPERSMLEYDHIEMHCRGGTDTVENLRLRCRYHNQAQARRELGRELI